MSTVFVISSLGPGGAERVISRLVNHWAEDGRRPVLLTLDDGSRQPFFPLHPEVRHRPLGLLKESRSAIDGILANLRRVRRLRAAIREAAPATVVSFIDRTNVLTLLATIGLDCRVVVSERIDPRLHPIGRGWTLLRRLVYPRADCVVVQTSAARSFFPPRVRARTVVVPNPVEAPTRSAAAAPVTPPGAPRRRRLLAAGRLVPQKGFDLLIEAFARVAPSFPDWELTIHGEGGSRAGLETARDRLGLTDRVRLPGPTRDLPSALTTADLFVLSSRYEGFPNVLCEAMAAGVPVVSFDCPSGPAEIVRDGVDGLLVPAGDVAGLADALARLMGDDRQRAAFARRAPEIAGRFSAQAMLAQWKACVHVDAQASRG